MVVFAKIRQAFTVVVGEVTHEAGVIVAVTEAEFDAIKHKVEVLERDVAMQLHLTTGHALAVSPSVAKSTLEVSAGVAQATLAELGSVASQGPAAPVTDQTPAPAAAGADAPAGGSAPTPADAQEAPEAVPGASDAAQGADSTGGAAA
nr:hypothetical protein [uncultured Acidocella sp.]